MRSGRESSTGATAEGMVLPSGTGYGVPGNSVGGGAFQSVELLDQRREGRVVGDGVESIASLLVRHGTDCLLDIRDDGGVDAGVLETHLHIVRTRAAGKGDKPWVSAMRSKSTS